MGEIKTNRAGTKYVIVNNEVTKKECTKCREMKSVTEFNVAKRNSIGFTSHCKACMGIKGKFRHAKLQIIEVDGESIEAKDCGKCGEVKPLSEFPVLNNINRKGVGGRYSTCSECEFKYRQDLYKCPKRLKRRARTRREFESTYHDRRKELYRINIEKERQRSKLKDAKRFALERKLPGNLTDEQYERTLKEFNQSCAISGETEDITIDHFIPLWTGHGGTHIGNVYPLSASLNYSKQNRNPFEWIKGEHIQRTTIKGAWDELITFLARMNSVSVETFEKYVNWCFENTREVHDINDSNKDSLKIFLKEEQGKKDVGK